MKPLRQKIDGIDGRILKLLARRKSVALKIAEYKKRNRLAPVDKKREQAMLKALKAHAKALGLSTAFVNQLFRLILAESRRLQL